MKKSFAIIHKCLFGMCLTFIVVSLIIQSLDLINLKKSINATLNSMNSKWHIVFGKIKLSSVESYLKEGVCFTLNTTNNDEIPLYIDENQIGIRGGKERGIFYTISKEELIKFASENQNIFHPFIKFLVSLFSFCDESNRVSLNASQILNKIHPVGIYKTSEETKYRFIIYSSDVYKLLSGVTDSEITKNLPNDFTQNYTLDIISKNNKIKSVFLSLPKINQNKYTLCVTFENGESKISISFNENSNEHNITLLREEDKIQLISESMGITHVFAYDTDKSKLFFSRFDKNEMQEIFVAEFNKDVPDTFLPLDQMSISEFFSLCIKINSISPIFKK